jgi:long-chain acyl-CoA synthetase
MTAEATNLVELLESSCARHAERKMFGTKHGDDWRWITYGEFQRAVDDLRAGLAELGIQAGDRVGIIAGNRVEWAATAYAVYGLGAALVPMFEVQKPEEWKFILADCGAKAVVCATNDMLELLSSASEELPELEHIIGLGLPDDDVRSYAALIARGAGHPQPAVRPAADDVAGFIYTSGTTGKPKGVMLSHGNICSNVNGIHLLLEFLPEDRSLSFLPWAHSFGQTAELHDLVSTGSEIAINDDVTNLVANLAVVRPTVLFAVPRIFNRIYEGVNRQMAAKNVLVRRLFQGALRTSTAKAKGGSTGVVDDLLLALADRLIFSKIRAKFGGRLKYTVSGSAALSQEVAQFVDALGIAVYEGYGLTETSPVVSSNCPGHRRMGSVGRPMKDVQVRIEPAEGAPPGEGEIVVSGPNVMLGYHNRPDDDAQVFASDGALRTGDLGRLDEDGYLFITGRIKEQYKLENGKYVVPSPLEEELKLSPFIANVMLYGADRPHNVALVVPERDALERWAAKEAKPLGDIVSHPAVKQLLADELNQRTAQFKSYEKPVDFAVVAEDFTIENGLLTPSMKVKRRAVADRYRSVIEALY